MIAVPLHPTGLVGADDAEAHVPNAGTELPSVRFSHGRGESRGGNVDSLFGQFDREDMLREVSKLPPSQRADALKKLEEQRCRDW